MKLSENFWFIILIVGLLIIAVIGIYLLIFGGGFYSYDQLASRNQRRVDLSRIGEYPRNVLKDDFDPDVRFWEEETEEQRQAEIEEFQKEPEEEIEDIDDDEEQEDDEQQEEDEQEDEQDDEQQEEDEEDEDDLELPSPPSLPSYKPSGLRELLRNLFGIIS